MFDVFYYGPKPNRFAFEQPAESLEDAASKSRTKYYWYIYGGNDYTGFDFSWQPAPWQNEYVHVFPSQWQRTGGVYFANKDTAHLKQWNFLTEQSVVRLSDRSRWIIPSGINDTGFDYSWHPDEIEPDYEYHFPTQWQRQGGPIYQGTAGIKFATGQKIRANATQIFYMDFLNDQSTEQFSQIQKNYPDVKLTRYVDNHLNVFKRIVNLATTEFVWIISSFCDYTGFDFTWHPAPEQREMIHVFPTYSVFGKTPNYIQPRGDTFYIHVPSLRNQLYDLEILDWFNVINYCKDQSVPTQPVPLITYSTDSLVTAVKQHNFKFPYAVFKLDTFAHTVEFTPPCIWHQKDRVVESLTASGSAAIVPRDARAEIKTQIYDYPYVIRNNPAARPGKSLDIIYISNKEPDAERWFDHLFVTYKHQMAYPIQYIKRVQDVDGRIAAYHAAARASETPWFFAVFAKLEVVSNFNWMWQPDYWQEPKHYIFHSRNCLNGLEYGHMGIIAYNKQLVLDTIESGLDFTLSAPHQVVPELSATAYFNADPWMTWRTAFREVVKLKHFMYEQPTIETEHRLHTWLNVASGDHAAWCLQGARDAVDYYNEVNGDYNKLMLSFDWPWLRERFNRCSNV